MTARRGPGRPRINEGEVMQTATLKISKSDLELLEALGYNTGEAIREFCNMKRRSNLPAYRNKEDILTKLQEEAEIQKASKAREQDLISQVAICEAAEAENAILTGDVKACKALTVDRLYDNRELLTRRGPGYLEKLRYCLSALPEGHLSIEVATNFFKDFDKKPPKLGDIENLVF